MLGVKDLRPRYHHGALATALLTEAVAQVRARGVDQVSLRGLAQQIGVSPSAAYQHFPDKSALLVAVGEWAFDELAARMRAAMATVALDGDAGAVARFAAIGRAYVGFAAGEPHLFRHMFGGLLVQHLPLVPTAAGQAGPAGPAGPAEVAGAVADGLPEQDSAHGILLERLAELERRGLLRPGVGVPVALDVLTWSLVHGFSALVIEGYLPLEAGEQLLLLYGRLVLRDDVMAGLDLDGALLATAPITP